ncbi:DUF5025 domain-containing protein [Sphingobacterium humi]|uniref:DUF5025 domain-containing protein n=1 Tax=Sphingobacterium humi TaxID=1796905 RepID=A0A6N8KXN9_9SPHI|nr:DUF5025 domain-containing protein [Sphingobacterium humi]MVZ60688.1 DUF5025 domain-containing protein [Sphingobacterium humi]
MKNTILLLLGALLLIKCSDKPDITAPTIDDTFFFAKIGKNGYDIKNDGAKGKAIRTIQEYPTYEFVFHHTFKTELFRPNIETTTLKVEVETPENDKTYSSATGLSDVNQNLKVITCEVATQEVETSPVEKKTYEPHDKKTPIILEVLKVDKDPSSGVKIVEGKIKGFLFNNENLKDSIEIDAHFRTKSYNQN